MLQQGTVLVLGITTDQKTNPESKVGNVGSVTVGAPLVEEDEAFWRVHGSVLHPVQEAIEEVRVLRRAVQQSEQCLR